MKQPCFKTYDVRGKVPHELNPEIAENTLIANDDPMASEELLDVRSAMLLLPFEQRQALALVGVIVSALSFFAFMLAMRRAPEPIIQLLPKL